MWQKSQAPCAYAWARWRASCSGKIVLATYWTTDGHFRDCLGLLFCSSASLVLPPRILIVFKTYKSFEPNPVNPAQLNDLLLGFARCGVIVTTVKSQSNPFFPAVINWLFWIDWVINWFVEWLIDELTGGSIDGLMGCFIDFWIDSLIVWLMDWFIDWLVDWWNDWFVGLQTDYLIFGKWVPSLNDP